MVDDGAAWVYDQYSDSALPRKLEDQARRAKRGLWALAQDKRMPPWQWRHGGKAAAGKMGGLITEFVNGMKEAADNLVGIIGDAWNEAVEQK